MISALTYLVGVLTIWQLVRVHGQECHARFNRSIVGYCSSVDKCQGTALSSAACGQQQCCISGTAPSASPVCITGGEFNALYSTPRAAFLRRILNFAVNRAGICDNCRAKAAFLGVAAAMTNDFTNDEAIGTDVQLLNDDDQYGNEQPGDGSRFRRRGFFGLRGRDMYQRLQTLLPEYQSLSQPESVALVENAMVIVARQWNNPDLGNEISLTRYADGTFYGLSMIWYKLTGDLAQLTEAVNHYVKFLRAMKCGGELTTGEGSTCQYNASQYGVCKPVCGNDFGQFGDFCGCSDHKGPQCPNSPAHVRCCLDICPKKMKIDLGLVIDASNPTDPINAVLQNRFVDHLIRRVNVGQNRTHVSIIHYADVAKVVSSFDADYTVEQKLSRHNQASKDSDKALVHLGLQRAAEQFLFTRSLRPGNEDTRQVLFVIGHRLSHHQLATQPVVQMFTENGIHLISVVFGNQDDANRRSYMPTSSAIDNNFQIITNEDIEHNVNQFLSRICSEPVPIVSNSTITGEVEKDKYTFFKIKIEIVGKKIRVTVTLLNGNVKLFFSFHNQNPRDPNESSRVALDTSTRLPEIPLSSLQPKSHGHEMRNGQITLPIDVPDTKPDFVYIGIKGLDRNNRFQVKFDDCAQMDCATQSATSSSTMLSLLLFFTCLLFCYHRMLFTKTSSKI